MSFTEQKNISDNLEQTRSSSSEDLEDYPLTGDDSPFPRGRRKRFSWPTNNNSFWKFYSLFMTAISIILLVTAIQNNVPSQICSGTEKPPLHAHLDDPPAGNHQLSDTWKHQNLVKTRFFRDLRYMSLDHETDYLWQEHQLMSTGNIRLPDGKGNTTLKGIAMFHQMHCLAGMRRALQLAKEGVDIGTDWRDDAHWPHCFDYLRESIMCYADPTLESVSLQPGPLDNGKFVKVIDGGAEVRYCRDTRPLIELERRYGPNSQYGFAKDKFEVAPGK
ncbi:hypothetical protein BKA66DRAFT_126286 [Pyrenochaeta sp. MPI-SDFR-AT-0127]|nr:hypothetical protein BKA66DRAFT_126286 [Pyrenochaeta sp. MPI-SDFR-AT-0127]